MLLGSQPNVEWEGVSLQFTDSCAVELSWLTNKEVTDSAVPQDRDGGDAEGHTKSRDIGEGTREEDRGVEVTGTGLVAAGQHGGVFGGKGHGCGRP